MLAIENKDSTPRQSLIYAANSIVALLCAAIGGLSVALYSAHTDRTKIRETNQQQAYIQLKATERNYEALLELYGVTVDVFNLYQARWIQNRTKENTEMLKIKALDQQRRDQKTSRVASHVLDLFALETTGDKNRDAEIADASKANAMNELTRSHQIQDEIVDCEKRMSEALALAKRSFTTDSGELDQKITAVEDMMSKTYEGDKPADQDKAWLNDPNGSLQINDRAEKIRAKIKEHIRPVDALLSHLNSELQTNQH
jgi:hypothetical protein